ncbi:MAG: PAS domain S-box protein [Gemmataceae bacterium]|nr:PAS domain S-box protein [Gemmataceae bacterium]
MTNERGLRHLLEFSSDMIASHAPDGTVRYVSPACRKLFGCEPEQLIGSDGLRFVHDEDRILVRDARQAAFRGITGSKVMLRIQRADRVLLWAEWQVCSVTRAESGELLEFISVTRDVTEQHRTEEQLQLFASAFQQVTEGILITDAQLDLPGPAILYANDCLLRMTGYAMEELVGQTPRIFQGPKTDRNVMQELKQQLGRGGSFTASVVNYRKDGSSFQMEIHAAPIRDGSGQTRHFVAVLRDTSAQASAEAARFKSERLVRGVLDALPAQIAVLDPSGAIVTVNESWRRFARENGADSITERGDGMNYLDVCRQAAQTGADEAGTLYRGIGAVLGGYLSEFHFEYPCDSPRGSRWFLMSATPLTTPEGGVIVAHHDVTERHQAAEAQSNLLGRLIGAQEDERRRIARDLHDGVAQGLMSLVLGLHAVEHMQDSEPVRAQFQSLGELLNDTLNDVRRMARGLRPATLDDLGFAVALQRHVAEFAGPHKLDIHLLLPEPGNPRLPAAVETALFRIVQEALSNVSRHAQARNVTIRLTQTPTAVELEIEDDGRGFDRVDLKQLLRDNQHLGLASMRERAALLGGTLELTAATGQGTRIRVRVPLRESRS